MLGMLSFKPLFDDPCLVHWDSCHGFYIQPDFSNTGVGFIDIQLTRDSVSMLVMCREMTDGQCEFLKDTPSSAVAPYILV